MTKSTGQSCLEGVCFFYHLLTLHLTLGNPWSFVSIIAAFQVYLSTFSSFFSDGVCVSVCAFPSPFVCYVLGQSGHFTSSSSAKSSKLQVLFRLVSCREQHAIGSDSTKFLFHVPLICQHNCWEVFEQVGFHCIAGLKLHYFYTVSTEYRISFGVFESLQWLKHVLSWEQSQVKDWRCELFLWLNLWFCCQSVFQVFI